MTPVTAYSAEPPSQARDRREAAPDALLASGALLSGSAMAILGLVAAHDGVSPRTFLTRAICIRAEQIGLQGLLDAFDTESNCEGRHGNSSEEILR